MKICDRCKTEKGYDELINSRDNRKIDLCVVCKAEFDRWLEIPPSPLEKALDGAVLTTKDHGNDAGSPFKEKSPGLY